METTVVREVPSAGIGTLIGEIDILKEVLAALETGMILHAGEMNLQLLI
jgi:hypothetical protein